MGELGDLALDARPLGLEHERPCVSVRQRMLQLLEGGLGFGRIQTALDALEERGEIVTHDRSIIERRRPRLHGPEGLSSQALGPSRRLLAVGAGALALAFVGGASAGPLDARLSRALGNSGISWATTGAIVTNLSTGRVVYARGHARSLRPASNQKLVVALAALDELGPSSKIPTHVLGMGARDGNVWRGSLFLKGFGDPTLSSADLVRLAARVRGHGIRRITGSVLGDESAFDRRRLGPGWKPSFFKLECPPLSALIVDRALVNGRTASRPAFEAAKEFKAALRAAGIRVPGKARVGVAPDDAELVTRTHSPRLSWIVQRMNKISDNFYAEMLLKRLGSVTTGRRGTSARGARAAREELADRGVPLTGVRIADGSGLSRDDRITAKALGKLLRSAWQDTRVREAFYASLARAGIDGTLDDRMESGPARDRVRAKTGTTNQSSALSGYVASRFAFAVLQNGSPVPWTPARRSQDRFAQILARRAA